jgi:hypothetical protein
MAEELFRFRNTTQGKVGAIKIDRRGDRRAISVAPGDVIELSEEEQEATANAPKDPANSPFEPQPYEARDVFGEVVDAGVRCPLELLDESDARNVPARTTRRTGTDVAREKQSEEVGAAPQPVGFAPQGSYAPGEEVGTP